jgi:hypothetical protein
MPSDDERIEALLARLYLDPDARASFVRDRAGFLADVELSAGARASLLTLDAAALEHTARSFEHKSALAEQRRAKRRLGHRAASWLRALLVR